jgi:hypothetical protein
MMVGQVLWERPELQRTLAEDPSIVPQESMRDQFTVRVYSWRLEGTFLLANTLATYLAMIWPLAACLCWRCWRSPVSSVATRWLLALFTLAITVGLALTGSKAGILSWTIILAAAVRGRVGSAGLGAGSFAGHSTDWPSA